MKFQSFAKSQMPKGAGQHRQRARCQPEKGRSSRTRVFEGFALVEKLIDMGQKADAVALFEKLTAEVS